MRSAEIDAAAGFEVLVEADRHSRTDLGVLRVVGAYALGKGDSATPPVTTLTTQIGWGKRCTVCAERPRVLHIAPAPPLWRLPRLRRCCARTAELDPRLGPRPL